MPLTNLICPDKQEIQVEDCLSRCRMAERCLTKATLAEIAEERVWNGVASTTQLLDGTMYQFLKLTKPFSVDPDSRIFALHGTHVHAQIEAKAKQLGLQSEIALSGDRDIIDSLEFEDGIWTITDYKTWGSYKVQKALGLVEAGKKPNPNGEVYKTSGTWGKAGTPKMVNVWMRMEQAVDMYEPELQLNHYRVLAKQNLNIDVTKLRVQAIVRDGGLQVATGRGIERNAYMIPVKILPDDVVMEYFTAKRNCLAKALESGGWDVPCDNIECWDGARCKGYCEVWMYCPKGQLLHKESV